LTAQDGQAGRVLTTVAAAPEKVALRIGGAVAELSLSELAELVRRLSVPAVGGELSVRIERGAGLPAGASGRGGAGGDGSDCQGAATVVTKGLANEHKSVDATVDGAFQDLLGHGAGASGYWHDEAHRMLDEGKTLPEVDQHIRGSLAQSDEYKLGHLAQRTREQVNGIFGGEAPASVVDGAVWRAEELKAEGKLPNEIEPEIDARVRNSAEFKAANTPAARGSQVPRGQDFVSYQADPSIYREQRNKDSMWSNCGPVALVALHRSLGKELGLGRPLVQALLKCAVRREKFLK